MIIVGAGAAGLGVGALLKRRGVEVTVLERGPSVASAWRARYQVLRLNSLGSMGTVPGHPLARRSRPFPTRDQWVRYLEQVCEEAELDLDYDTDVAGIERDGRGFLVETSKGAHSAETVVVATGMDREPVIPNWPGRETFSGEFMHAAAFKTAEPFRGLDVLVVGAGNTGAEVAHELAEHGAKRVRVAVRTPPNLFTRTWHRVVLYPGSLLLDRLPVALADRAGWWMQRMLFGDLTEHGVSRSPHGVKTTVLERGIGPTVDAGFVDDVKSHRIEIVSAVTAFDAGQVVLADGVRLQPDAVIAATGYRPGLETLVGHLVEIDPRFGQPAVDRHQQSLDAPGLYFVGYWSGVSGPLRQIRKEVRAVARAIAASERRRAQPTRRGAGVGLTLRAGRARG